jgi:glycosyltransferase involved in cell wall biosynthesis
VRVLVDYRPALRARTGVGEYVHELVRALARPGGPAPQGSLTLFSASWKDRLPAGLADELQVRIVHRRVPVRPLTWTWNRLGVPPVEWLAGEADVIHSGSPVAIPSRSGRSVLTIHDLHFLRHPERMTAEMRRDFPELVRSHAARADAIIVSSQYTASDVTRSLQVSPARIHLCPPGAPAWAPDVARRRETRARQHILFLGTLEPRKNVGALLEAYAQLTATNPGAPPLVVAGRLTPTGVEWQARAHALGLEGRVHWPGYVSDQARQELYAAAHMLVLPSLDEGFGLPVLEAMASGVPVVISTGGSLPEVAGDAARPIRPDDVTGLHDAMAALLDTKVAAAAARRGLARAEAFRWDDCARKVWLAYQAALEGRS